jgi:RNA polymerase sigma-70 factor, ECF subfamily
MIEDDAKLIQRAKAGDPQAFSTLYDRYQPRIYRYVYFRVHDVPLAEDLTSEVFVRLVENIQAYRDAGRPFLAWLYTIARNLLTDHYRREARALLVPVDDTLLSDGVDPARHAQSSFEQQQLLDALAQLTDDQRQVIELKFFEEVDNTSVALLLNKTVGAVKSLQHRALASLARLLITTEEGV